MNSNLKLKLGLLHRISIEFDPMNGVHNTVDIQSDGLVRYSIPAEPNGEMKLRPFEARELIRDRASALFMRESDTDGDPADDAYHWKAVFYSKKGVIRTMEGWRGEPQDRLTDFEVFLSELEDATSKDFGAFVVEKMARERAEAQRIAAILSQAKELAAARANPASDAILRVAQKLLKQTTRDLGSRENMMISPVSIEIILSLLAYAAQGQTRSELLNYLGTDSIALLDDINTLAKMVATDHAASVANAIYVDKDVLPFVLPSYIAKIKEFGITDLLPPGVDAEAINRWVAEKTNRMIPSILPPEEKLSDLIILNAIAFEAAWRDEYDDYNILDGIFYRTDGGMEKAHFLHSTEDYLIYNDEAIGFLKPYKDCGFSFMAMLPQKTKNPIEFISTLQENALGDMIRGAAQVPVTVKIPEYSFDSTFDIKALLQDAGVVSAFDRNRADIGNMLPIPNSYISGIKHKTHVEVDRNGTRAATVTMAAVAAGCLPDFPRFEGMLDRPFVFGIVHNGSGVPLFLGVVNTLKSCSIT